MPRKLSRKKTKARENVGPTLTVSGHSFAGGKTKKETKFVTFKGLRERFFTKLAVIGAGDCP
jgi:hypothetical protein